MEDNLLLFRNSFEGMIKQKEVDLGALSIINSLKNELKERMGFIIRQDFPKHKMFHIYHSTKIGDNVLDSIATRLKKAKENKDNPEIAKDALSIYPSFFALIRNLNRLDLKDKNIETFPLLSLTSDLQVNAIGSNLFHGDGKENQALMEKAKEIVSNLDPSILNG